MPRDCMFLLVLAESCGVSHCRGFARGQYHAFRTQQFLGDSTLLWPALPRGNDPYASGRLWRLRSLRRPPPRPGVWLGPASPCFSSPSSVSRWPTLGVPWCLIGAAVDPYGLPSEICRRDKVTVPFGSIDRWPSARSLSLSLWRARVTRTKGLWWPGTQETFGRAGRSGTPGVEKREALLPIADQLVVARAGVTRRDSVT